MNNNIPTTDDMRDIYAYESDDTGGAYAEFDAWLEQHNAEIVEATEERIIALLENPELIDKWNAQRDSFGTLGDVIRFIVNRIKGDNDAV